jgi:predicted HAD superfamily Cof-like phosphohydrolase
MKNLMKNQEAFSDLLEKLKEFNRSFEISYLDAPFNLGNQQVELRYNLMKEELDEYKDAALKGDIVEVADALGDKLYILLGTILAHGMQDIILDVFNEIHRSNMTKLTEDGKVLRREDGKIIKSDRYQSPNLAPIVLK